MGFEQVEQLKEPMQLRDFSGGLYYNKKRSAIPDNAAEDCDRVLWLNRRLTRTPGFVKAHTSALNSGAVGLGGINFRNDTNNLVCVYGNKIFDDCSTTTPVDITGAYSLSSTERVQFYEFKEGANKYIIGAQKGSAPFKFTGTGNISALGGSPPNCKFVTGYNRFIWIANAANAENRVYWSGLTAPETWDTTNQYIAFPQNITGLAPFGGDLLVFMPDRIGKITGFGSDTFTVLTDYVTTIGCISGYTVVPVKVFIGGVEKDLLIFLSKDGLYGYDGSPTPIKLSVPIEKKFTGNSTERFAATYLENASASFLRANGNYYVLSVPDAAATTNNLTYWIDLNHFQQLEDGSYAPAFWPITGTNASMLVNRFNSSDRDELFFLSSDGFTKKYSFVVLSEDGAGKKAYYFSKTYDFVNDVQIREANLLGDYVGNFEIDFSLNFDQATGTEEVVFAPSSDLLDTTFILDVSQLADANFVVAAANFKAFGRFGQLRVTQDATASADPDDETFQLEGIDLLFKDLGKRSRYIAA